MGMARDIIIYGGNSVLAKNFIKSLHHTSDNKIIITRKSNFKKNILFNTSKILNKYDLQSICSNIFDYSKFGEKVFILFSWSGIPRSLENDAYHWERNRNIISNFLNIAKMTQAKRVVFISSAGSVYSPHQNKRFDELARTYACNNYGKQKLKAERIIGEFVKDKDIKCTILRVATAYGYDKRFSDQGVINKWLYAAINNQILRVYNSIDSLINFISFDQISDAIKRSINNEINGIYNIGSIESTSLNEILLEIEKTVQKKINYELVSEKVRNFNIDIGKFYKETGIFYKNEITNNIKFIHESIIRKDL